MGEIDTNPIESVQTVISFFGQSNEQKKNSPIKDEEEEEVVCSHLIIFFLNFVFLALFISKVPRLCGFSI